MPVVVEFGLLVLPELEEDARPDGHEVGEEHGRPVIEHVREPGDGAAVLQSPVGAGAVAVRAHGQVACASFVAHLGKIAILTVLVF